MHVERLCAAKLTNVMKGVSDAPKPKEIYTTLEVKLRRALKLIGEIYVSKGPTADILEIINKALKL